MKGFVLAKLTTPGVCPVKLVQSVFQRIEREKLPCAKHLVRMIPLQKTFFPDIPELRINLLELVEKEFGSVDEKFVQIVMASKRPISDVDGDISDTPAAKLANTGDNQCEDAETIPVQVENVDAIPPSTDESSCVDIADVRLKNTVALQKYNILFNRRNHNVLNRNMVYSEIIGATARRARYQYTNFTVSSLLPLLL